MQTTANVTNGAGDPDDGAPVNELDASQAARGDASRCAAADAGERPPYVDLYAEEGAAVGGPLRWRVVDTVLPHLARLTALLEADR